MKTFRRIAREAVIFTLLGPVAVVGYYITVEIYNAPSRAQYTIVGVPDFIPAEAAEKRDDGTGLPYFVEEDAFYIQDYDAKWLRFAPNVSSGSVTRTLN